MVLKFYEVVLFLEIFFICFFISFICDYFVIKYSLKFGFFIDKDSVDKPQKMHSGNIPRSGGIGIFAGAVVAILFGMSQSSLNDTLIYLLIPMVLAFFSGILEDFNNSLPPLNRLLLQTLSALSAVYLFDCVIIDIGFKIPYLMGVILSVFAIVGVINAMNIIDGFNGLASGYGIMVFLSMAIVSFLVDDKTVCYLSITFIAVIFGFFVLNFPKGRIFLGDGGAYLIGLLLAVLLIKLTQSNNVVSAWYGLCVMIYPIFEVMFSMYRKKILRNTSAMQPDSVHFHMLVYKRLRRENYKTSIFIWLLNIPFVFLPILFFDSVVLLIVFICLFIVIYVVIYKRIITFSSLKL